MFILAKQALNLMHL
jgi:hypothetical protein